MTMNLATRCNACGTVFRVVTDQLRVSEGWVRCGRCDAVFSATESLFDIDSGTPVQIAGLAPAAGPPPQAMATAVGSSGAAAPDDDPLADVVPADWQQHQQRQALARRIAANSAGEAPLPEDAGLNSSLLRQASPPAADTAEIHDGLAGADADAVALHRAPQRPVSASGRLGARLQAGAGALVQSLSGALAGVLTRRRAPPAGRTAAQATAHPTAAPPPPDTPTFLREADSAAFWQRPGPRLALQASAALLAALLAAQGALLWRDTLAARLPVLAPALGGLCQLAGCRVLPLRQLDQIGVDSSGLNRVDNTPYYRFSVLLRNRADTAVMTPAMELSLTDNLGALVARRVFLPGELGATRELLERGQEVPIQVLLSTGERRVEGYTLELFYP